MDKIMKQYYILIAIAAAVYSGTSPVMTMIITKMIDYEKFAGAQLVFMIAGILSAWIGKNEHTWAVLKNHWKIVLLVELMIFPVVNLYTEISGDLFLRWIIMGTIVEFVGDLTGIMWNHMMEKLGQARVMNQSLMFYRQVGALIGMCIAYLSAKFLKYEPPLEVIFTMQSIISMIVSVMFAAVLLKSKSMEE